MNTNATCAERAEAEALHWRDQLDVAVVELASARDERVVAGIEHRIATAARRVREAKRAAALYRQRADVTEVSEQHMPCCAE